MNPLTTIATPQADTGVQRIDSSRAANPVAGSDASRAQQSERARQPTSAVSVNISEAASALASADLAATQSVAGSNAASAASRETRDADADDGAPRGRLVDERA